MNKRYFFISFVIINNGFWGTSTWELNATISTENGKYFNLRDTQEAILKKFKEREDVGDNSELVIRNIIELNKEDWETLSPDFEVSKLSK